MDYKKLSRITDSVKKLKDYRSIDYRQWGGPAKEVFKDTEFNGDGGNEFTENSFTLPTLGKIAHRLALSGAKWFCSTPEEVECYTPSGMVAFIGYETPVRAYFHKGVGPEDYVDSNSSGEEISLSKAYKLCGIASGHKEVGDSTRPKVKDTYRFDHFSNYINVADEHQEVIDFLSEKGNLHVKAVRYPLFDGDYFIYQLDGPISEDLLESAKKLESGKFVWKVESPDKLYMYTND